MEPKGAERVRLGRQHLSVRAEVQVRSAFPRSAVFCVRVRVWRGQDSIFSSLLHCYWLVVATVQYCMLLPSELCAH